MKSFCYVHYSDLVTDAKGHTPQGNILWIQGLMKYFQLKIPKLIHIYHTIELLTISSSMIIPCCKVQGLVKKLYLLPNFLVVNGSVLKIGMDIHWRFTYTQEKLWNDNFTILLYVTSSKERFGTPETVKIKDDLSRPKLGAP